MLTRAVVTHKVCGFALWSGEIRVKSEKPRESTDVGEKVVLSFGCTGCGEATRSITGSTLPDAVPPKVFENPGSSLLTSLSAFTA